jgi:hypothetical protein
VGVTAVNLAKKPLNYELSGFQLVKAIKGLEFELELVFLSQLIN